MSIAWHSLLGTGVVVTQLDIKVSQLHARRQEDGQIDLAALLPHPDPTTPWPNLTILRATLEAQDVDYTDPAHGPDAQFRLSRLSVSTHDFALRAPSSSWRVDLSSDQKETVSAQVQLSLSPLQLRSTWAIEDFRLARLGAAGFAVAPEMAGLMGAEGEVLFATEPRPAISIKQASLHGTALSVKLPGDHAPELKAGHWSIGELSYAERVGIRVDNVSLHEQIGRAHV